MKRIEKLCLLIHGFCWACQDYDTAYSRFGARLNAYLAREQACIQGWYAHLQLADNEALAVIPAGLGGPAGAFYAQAAAALGDRFFMLECPDSLNQRFWADLQPGDERSILEEVKSALVHQHLHWNKEELQTALHCNACCRRFTKLLAERGYCIDPANISVEAWGASFEGCVTKYTLNIRRMLGLARVIEIAYGLTVPDAAFLLPIMHGESILLGNGLRLTLFTEGNRSFGIYAFTSHSLADQPAWVEIAAPADDMMVLSKQGIRLWPEPEEYVLMAVPPEYYEPPEMVVRRSGGGLQVPVNAGYVYRLAKAPAYVFLPQCIPFAEARTILASAVLLEGNILEKGDRRSL